MNKSQARHASSIAKHMLQYTAPFTNLMEAYERAKPGDMAHMSTQTFENEINMSLAHMKQELDGVVKDMMGDLHVQ